MRFKLLAGTGEPAILRGSVSGGNPEALDAVFPPPLPAGIKPPTSRWWRALQIVTVGRHPKRTLARIALLVVTSIILFRYVLLPIRVTGISMLPTYRDRSVNFVNRLAYLWHPPKRGDVVDIRTAQDAEIHLTFMKRVIGLPGETVSFQNGRTLINGQVIEEPYLKLPCDWGSAPVKLKNDEYYVVGDNRSMPPADHWHRPVPLSRIVGKVIL